MNRIQRQNSGFTLFEMLISLTILSILTFIAIPFYSDIMEKRDLNTAKSRIIHSLQKAKRIANAENTLVDITIANNTIQLSPKNKTESLSVKIPGRITTDTDISFTFNSTGTIYNEDDQSIDGVTSIKINPESNPSLFETITISNTGIIASL